MTPDTPTPLVDVAQLTKHYPRRQSLFGRRHGEMIKAVDGVSLSIHQKRTLGLVGESGCGKSTLGRLVVRLTAATSGRVWFEGRDVLAASGSELRQLRSSMQIVFQDPFSSLNPRMTAGEIVAEGLLIQGVNRAQAIRQVAATMDLVGLARTSLGRYPHEFSGGQRQRICIARAIVMKPKFVVCDEVVSALDVSVQSQVLNLLRDIQNELGISYLFISHNLAVVNSISDHVAVMYFGRIVESGTRAEIFDSPQHPYTRALIDSVPLPDRHKRRQRSPIRGDVPDPFNPPPGCAFSTRCPHASDECRTRFPDDVRLSATHHVACVHARDLTRVPPPGH